MVGTRAWLIVLVAGFAAPALAVDGRSASPGGFSTEIDLGQNFTYDSNPLRVADDEDSIFGSTTSPQLVIRKKTPTATVESDSKVDANYFNHSQFNSVDLHQKFFVSKQNQRWTASLRASGDYDTTRTSELTNYALHIPKVRRTRLNAAPQITFRPNAQDSWSLLAAITDVNYDNSAYTDYRYYSAGPSYEHRFDPENKGTISFTAERYETTSNSALTSDSYGPTVGWVSLLSPQLTLKLSAGVESTEKRGTNAGSDPDSWNYVFSGNLAYKGSADTLDFTATRAREPFGNGTETLLTTLRISEKHAINRVLSLNAEALYQDADYSTEPGINLDRGWGAGGGITYRWYDNVDLTANYKYRNEDLTRTGGSIDQHIVMLGFSIHPAWSRD